MLSHVTFTGWDRHTDLEELATFLEDSPQDRIEIAVLHSTSRSRDDDDRYPNVDKAMAILRTAKAAGQRTAVHLCGRIARAFLSYPDAIVKIGPLIQLADRVQINVAEDFWATSSPEKYRAACITAQAISRPVIIQSRDLAGWPDVEHFWPGASRMVPFLFDRSAGAGVESLAWPVPSPGRLVGYAGGLGPVNVAELCSCLAETAGARVWLDMETRIREPFQVQQSLQLDHDPPAPTFLSIAKCRQVMRAVDYYFGETK